MGTRRALLLVALDNTYVALLSESVAEPTNGTTDQFGFM